MKSLMRNALLGAAGLVALSLSANAAQRPYDPSAGSVGFKKNTTQQQLSQRPYDPSAGSVGFRNENPGGVGFKKSKKKKAKK